jgi:hypothetical protein
MQRLFLRSLIAEMFASQKCFLFGLKPRFSSRPVPFSVWHGGLLPLRQIVTVGHGNSGVGAVLRGIKNHPMDLFTAFSLDRYHLVRRRLCLGSHDRGLPFGLGIVVRLDRRLMEAGRFAAAVVMALAFDDIVRHHGLHAQR